jgi:hypothetical protein
MSDSSESLPQHAEASSSSSFSSRRPIKGKSGGPGKKGKIFSESLGLSHLLSLASAAGSTEEDRNSQRAEKNRESAQWKKKKRVEKNSRKEAAGKVSRLKARGSFRALGETDPSLALPTNCAFLSLQGKSSSTSTDPSSAASPGTSAAARTKAVIRAELKAQRREKTKLRKEKRKQLAADVSAYDSDDEEAKARRVKGPLKAQPAKKYKTVSFA